MEINVFVLTADVNSQGAQLVAGMFDNPLFSVHLTCIAAPPDATPKQAESFRISTVLEEAQKLGSSRVLIIKDTSVTHASPDTIARVVRAALESSRYDLFYLCRWQDTCTIRETQSLSDSTISMYACAPSDGIQALLLSERAYGVLRGILPLADGRMWAYNDTLSMSSQLQALVAQGDLTAGCTVSNLVEYNILLARKPSDYRKTVRCSPGLNQQEIKAPQPEPAAVEDEDESEPIFDSPAPDRDASFNMDREEPLRELPVDRKRRSMRAGWVIVSLVLIVLIIGLLLFFFAGR